MRKRKSTVTQRPRRVFLVICEGETEKTYVETLKRHYRLPIAIKTKVSGNAISERLVKRYLNELDLRAGDDFEVFYIYDSDVKSVAEKICSLPGIAILTNPRIELWFLLHLKDHRRHIESEEAVKNSCRRTFPLEKLRERETESGTTESADREPTQSCRQSEDTGLSSQSVVKHA